MANAIEKQSFKFSGKKIALTILGCLVLAFGTAIFLTNLQIISGGVSGIGIIVQHLIVNKYPNAQVIDIVVAILSVILWIIGWVVFGKKFAFKTLIATIFYPIFLSLFLRVDAFKNIAINIAGEGEVGNKLLCAIFGGIFVGGGVAITFVAGASTGGVDVITLMLDKYFSIKESVGSFIIDGTVILLGMLLTKEYISCLCGVINTFMASLVIEYIYIGFQTSYQVDIISDQWEKISDYAQNELGRGATVIPAKGGFKGDERIILRVVFASPQYRKLRRKIAEIDPEAFMTVTRTNAVYGEGFKVHKKK